MVNRGKTPAPGRQRFEFVAKLQASTAGAIRNPAAKSPATGFVGLPLVATELRVIDATEIDQLLELKLFLIAQPAGDIEQIFGAHFHGQLAEGDADRVCFIAQRRAQCFRQMLYRIRHLSGLWC